ncbi:DNA-binding transcriptional regulator HcaR [Streptomyces sp. YIM 130001]|uniref:LysR family substrate-binding domain-containing protein n=1 Tax=Streptomyces sp. YIM 130001 TaxID=2259644 RepID=UPI000E6551A1|nr:LysR family substrate-binding domain-containing protein [Streptomyces sp. YIM 130001]RII09351.1 DNA-binding transcriptional regulator HcaR [Streptomyces sp. YIM 130001]
MTGAAVPPPFRLAYVPGATPGKWARLWRERLPRVELVLDPVTAEHAPDALLEGEADAGLLRLPVDTALLHAIPLYTETTVVVVPKDHLVTAADEVNCADLAEDVLLHPLDDTLDWERPPGEPAFERPATTGDAIDLVAAGIGLLVVPQSLARLHHRKDLTYRAVTDAPTSQVALSWPKDSANEQVEDLIGIVRGRTVNSTRGRAREKNDTKASTGRASAAGKSRTDKAGGRSAGRGTGGGPTGRTANRGAKPGAARRGKPRRRS